MEEQIETHQLLPAWVQEGECVPPPIPAVLAVRGHTGYMYVFSSICKYYTHVDTQPTCGELAQFMETSVCK